MYKLTLFEASRVKKIPISLFGDKTFEFKTIVINSNFEFLYNIGKHFILNQPFKEIGTVRSYRRISSLKDYYVSELDYIIIDVDDVHTKADMDCVVDYFKKYKVILGESFSYNGKDNFRLKGVLFCETGSFKDIQHSLHKIAIDLKDYCKIDESRAFIPSFNAPSDKVKVVLNNDNGILFQHKHIIKHEKTKNIQINEVDYSKAESIKDVCLLYFESLGFECVKNENGKLKFKHYSEVKTPCGYSWSEDNPYHMRHWNNTKMINAFSEVIKIPEAKRLLRSSLNYDQSLLKYNTKTNLINVNSRYLELSDIIKHKITEFIDDDVSTFMIRSPMGTAKSTIIAHIISEASDHGQKCLIITNRISVAEDFCEKYNVGTYLETKYKTGDSLICQYDSLWKYDLRDFDIVIMDEFISLMCHSRSELQNSSVSLAKFFAAFNKKIVIADAFLTGYEQFLIPTDKIYLLDNSYRDDTKLFDYKNKNNFVLKILQTAKKHKITVSSTSLVFLNDLRSLLQFNNIRTASLTSETPITSKKLIYKLFESEKNDAYDVLLYSPTLTVGVSNLNDIDYHFHYDSANSADVISSIQMIKRTRKAKEIHFFVKESYAYLQTSYEQLKKSYLENVGSPASFNMMFKIDDYGDVQISDVGKKAIKIDVFKNILETNHREAFLWFLKYQFSSQKIDVDKIFDTCLLSRHNKLNKISKEIQNKECVSEFLNLSGIEQAELLTSGNYNLKRISDAYDKLNLKKISESELQVQIKKSILEYAVLDFNFVKHCKRHKLMRGFLNKEYSEDDIRLRLQESITQTDAEATRFYIALLNFNLSYSEFYEFKDVSKKQIEHVIISAGYKIHASTGKRYYMLQNNVKELYDYFVI